MNNEPSGVIWLSKFSGKCKKKRKIDKNAATVASSENEFASLWLTLASAQKRGYAISKNSISICIYSTV